MPKFEAKREILHKFGKNWGGGASPPAPTAPPRMYLSFRHIPFSLTPPLAFKVCISDPTMDKYFCSDSP